MNTKIYFPFFMAMIISFVACQNSNEKENNQDELSDKKEKLEKSLSQIRSDLDDRIVKLTEESKEVGEDARQQVSSAIQRLQTERKKVINLLEDVNKASGEGLKKLEKDVENTKEDLVDEFQQISEESKSWFKDQMEKEL